MSNNSKKNQKEIGDKSHQLELQESHIEDEKYNKVEK